MSGYQGYIYIPVGLFDVDTNQDIHAEMHTYLIYNLFDLGISGIPRVCTPVGLSDVTTN